MNWRELLIANCITTRHYYIRFDSFSEKKYYEFYENMRAALFELNSFGNDLMNDDLERVDILKQTLDRNAAYWRTMSWMETPERAELRLDALFSRKRKIQIKTYEENLKGIEEALQNYKNLEF